MTRRIQPAVNFPRGVEVLNPLSVAPASIVIPLVRLSFLRRLVVRGRQPLIDFPRTFFSPVPGTRDTRTHFSVIRYSFLIFYGSLVYFPVSSFSIVPPHRGWESDGKDSLGLSVQQPLCRTALFFFVKNIAFPLPPPPFFILAFFNLRCFPLLAWFLNVLISPGSSRLCIQIQINFTKLTLRTNLLKVYKIRLVTSIKIWIGINLHCLDVMEDSFPFFSPLYSPFRTISLLIRSRPSVFFSTSFGIRRNDPFPIQGDN